MSSFISSHPGPLLMLGFLVAVLGGGALLLLAIRGALPPGNPIRARAEAWAMSIKKNPERFGKQLQYLAFGLIMLTFVVITLVYS